jgi:tetratricopeptide (TPR) repeat protein
MGTALRIGAASVLAAAALVVGAARPVEPARRETIPAVDDAAWSARVAGPAAGTIAALQARLREVPSDWRTAAALGLAYVQHARITADPTAYPSAEWALRRSLDLNPENAEGLVGMGSLALARHDFREALAWGRRAVWANPHGTAGYGVLGDALVELGRYRAAFRAFQRMADLRPDISVYARASYARELQGDVAGAIGLMRMAERVAASQDDAAWAAFELGELFWSSGRVRKAEISYRRAARLAPAFVAPRAGLARVAWARGRMGEAIRRYTAVVARFPAPDHVAALGDLYAMTGRKRQAEDQFALVAAEQALFEANGVNVDVETALFDADHGRPFQALRSARAAWSERKSVYTADAVAWALHTSERDRAALRFADRALDLGTRNALFLYHAGMIHLGLKHEYRARALLAEALRTNPFFSIIHAPLAHHALRRLEGRA